MQHKVWGSVRALALAAVLAAPAALDLAIASGGEVAPAAPATGYIFGVYPALPLAKLDQLFSPLAQEISRAVGRPVRFRSASSYAKYSQQLRAGAYDLALVHPFDFVRNAAGAGYLPLARKNEDLTAILVVPESCPVRSIGDLRNKIVAMPPRGSAVSLLALAEFGPGQLPGAGLVTRHFGEHDSSLQ